MNIRRLLLTKFIKQFNLIKKFKILLLLIFSFIVSPSYAENRIAISNNSEIGAVNKRLFGSNVLAYDPYPNESWAEKSFNGFTDYGAGIWDPVKNKPVSKAIALSKEMGVIFLRFPGGGGANHYDWRKALDKQRKSYLFGINEFLVFCREINAVPVYTVSLEIGDETLAAELVATLKNKIKYFEIGNEIHSSMSPEKYAEKYISFSNSMKYANGDIALGIVLWTNHWNKKLLTLVKHNIDFGILHVYPNLERSLLDKLSANQIYSSLFYVVEVEVRQQLLDVFRVLEENAGLHIPIAITEYNVGSFDWSNRNHRVSLGAALVNAELLDIFMEFNDSILFANCWDLVSNGWGSFTNNFNDQFQDLNKDFYLRPNYLMFEMFHKHFGDILLGVAIKSDSYDGSVYQPIRSLLKRIKTGTVIKPNLLTGGWEKNPVGGIRVKDVGGILEIEFIQPEQFNYYHTVKRANVEVGTYYKLSGYVRTENLNDDKGVCLEVQDARGWNATHSAEATDKITGTTDWQYVETVYETLSDTKAVKVLARRVGETGPLQGKVFFKDVRLEKFIPSLDTKIPYLSVNASKSHDGKKVYLMVVNKNMGAPMTATIDLKDFVPALKGNAWVLNGPSIDATNEQKHDNVKVTHHEFEIKDTPFEFTFEPHSLTAIEIDRKEDASP